LFVGYSRRVGQTINTVVNCSTSFQPLPGQPAAELQDHRQACAIELSSLRAPPRVPCEKALEKMMADRDAVSSSSSHQGQRYLRYWRWTIHPLDDQIVKVYVPLRSSNSSKRQRPTGTICSTRPGFRRQNQVALWFCCRAR
jgi:hypothetical protein